MIVYGYIGKDVMNTTERLIVLLRSIINSDIAFNCDDISMDDFFYYARQHKVENLCYGAIKKSAITIGEDWISKWEDVCEENTAQLMFQEAEKERLVEAFNDAKIDFLPLKGWYLRDIYPKQEYRFMSDLDILVHRSDREAVNVLLKELGYSGEMGDYGKDDSYMFQPCIHVEMHFDMVSVEQERWFDYYQSIWEKAVLVSDYEYKLSWNDFFIYMMINYLKDYTLKGTGIRSIIDFYFFLDKYKSTLDFVYINEEFRKLDIYDLAQETLQLVEDWFGDNPKIYGNVMGDRLLNSGIYGTSKELVQHRYDNLSSNVKGKKAKRMVYLFRRAFPGMKIMKYKYPILNKNPFLLPFYWCVRLIRHSDRAILEIKTIKKIDN